MDKTTCEICGHIGSQSYPFAYGIETNVEHIGTSQNGSSIVKTYRHTYKKLGEDAARLCRFCINKRLRSYCLAYYLPILPWLLLVVIIVWEALAKGASLRSEESIASLIGTSIFGFPIYYFWMKASVKRYRKNLDKDINRCGTKHSIVLLYQQNKVEWIKNTLNENDKNKFRIYPGSDK